MAQHSEAELTRVLQPIMAAVERQSGVAGRFVDKNIYCIYLATLWANLVLDPAAVGLAEDDLEGAHDVINLAAARILGEDKAINAAFRFINGRDGERAMDEAKLTRTHRDLLAFFCSMILDPDGHRRWLADQRERVKRPGYRNQSDSQGR